MQLIRHYQLIEPIGQGGMGTIYRAIDTRSGATVAIKALRRDTFDPSGQWLERFQREGEALRQLNHPNIVKWLETIVEDGGHYLVLEYVAGGDLRDLLARTGPLSLRRCLALAVELADALARAHHLKIIHRDLKPSNILIGDDGTPRLTDFGVADLQEVGRITSDGVAVGTPDYMPPEALSGDALDARADLWSFGVILYEMLSGRHPFVGATLTHTLNNILTQAPPSLEADRPDAPLALVDLIYRLLEKDPLARIPSARATAAELEAIIRGESLSIEALHKSAPPTPTPSLDAIPHNLPSQVIPLIGRDAELAAFQRLLDDPQTRLITIIGHGGVGKTRFAIEVGLQRATAADARFSDGIYFVDLAPQTRVEGVLIALAEALGYAFQLDARTPQTQLADYLRDKRALLIMDNFEHVLGAAGLVAAILARAPQVVIIVTSRARLNLSGEALFTLDGLLALAPSDSAEWRQSAALQLFAQSAKRAYPAFELNDQNISGALQVCQLVEGLPLAIMLAASWCGMLSPQEIAEEIRRDLGFLEAAAPDLPPRQHSIQRLCDYSWSLLTDAERAVFARLALFRGGFTRSAALAVSGGSLRVLARLLNLSLIRRDPTSGRYSLHELLRQYAAQRLKASGAMDATIRAHLAFFAQFADEHGARLESGPQTPILSIVEADMENIRLAWANAIALRDEQALRQLANLLLFYEIRGWYLEAQQTYQSALAVMGEGDNLASAYLLRGLCVFTYRLNQSDLSEKYSRAAIEMLMRLGQPRLSLVPRANLGNILAFVKGDLESGRRIYEEGLALAAQSGGRVDSLQRAFIYNLGAIAIAQWDLPQARQRYEQGLKTARRDGDRLGISFGLLKLAEIAHLEGDIAQSVALYTEALANAREIDQMTIAFPALLALAEIALRSDDLPQAQARLGEAQALAEAVTMRDQCHYHALQGRAAAAVGDVPSARHHLRHSLALISALAPQDQTLCLLFLPALYAAIGHNARATALCAYLDNHPTITTAHKRRHLEPTRAQLEAEYPQAVYARWWEHGQSLADAQRLQEWLAEDDAE